MLGRVCAVVPVPGADGCVEGGGAARFPGRCVRADSILPSVWLRPGDFCEGDGAAGSTAANALGGSAVSSFLPEAVGDGAAAVESHQPADAAVVSAARDAARGIAGGDGAAVEVVSHQPADVAAVSAARDAARGIAGGDGAADVVSHQPADVASAARDVACGMAVGDGAAAVVSHQPADVVSAARDVARGMAVGDGAAVVSCQYAGGGTGRSVLYLRRLHPQVLYLAIRADGSEEPGVLVAGGRDIQPAHGVPLSVEGAGVVVVAVAAHRRPAGARLATHRRAAHAAQVDVRHQAGVGGGVFCLAVAPRGGIGFRSVHHVGKLFQPLGGVYLVDGLFAFSHELHVRHLFRSHLSQVRVLPGCQRGAALDGDVARRGRCGRCGRFRNILEGGGHGNPRAGSYQRVSVGIGAACGGGLDGVGDALRLARAAVGVGHLAQHAAGADGGGGGDAGHIFQRHECAEGGGSRHISAGAGGAAGVGLALAPGSELPALGGGGGAVRQVEAQHGVLGQAVAVGAAVGYLQHQADALVGKGAAELAGALGAVVGKGAGGGGAEEVVVEAVGAGRALVQVVGGAGPSGASAPGFEGGGGGIGAGSCEAFEVEGVGVAGGMGGIGVVGAGGVYLRPAGGGVGGVGIGCGVSVRGSQRGGIGAGCADADEVARLPGVGVGGGEAGGTTINSYLTDGDGQGFGVAVVSAQTIVLPTGGKGEKSEGEGGEAVSLCFHNVLYV